MKMTKKDLVWRLKELPDAVDVAELVDKKVITPEEARDLLFNKADSDSEKIKDLKKQIEFLEDLVKELSKNQPINVYPALTPGYVEKWIGKRDWEPNWL